VARAAVEQRLSGAADAITAFAPGGATCAFTQYITPGLDAEP
jgi:hypothetical protein